MTPNMNTMIVKRREMMSLFVLAVALLSLISSVDSISFASSASSFDPVQDHEESEQVQAFVIADPSSLLPSSSSPSSQSVASNQQHNSNNNGHHPMRTHESSQQSAQSHDQPQLQSYSSAENTVMGDSEAMNISPIAASILMNLASNLNGMDRGATMSYPIGGGSFFRSRDPCSGCGCKCGHGSMSAMCQLCLQRGYAAPRSPCPCSKNSMDPMLPAAAAASYYYPIYRDYAGYGYGSGYGAGMRPAASSAAMMMMMPSASSHLPSFLMRHHSPHVSPIYGGARRSSSSGSYGYYPHSYPYHQAGDSASYPMGLDAAAASSPYYSYTHSPYAYVAARPSAPSLSRRSEAFASPAAAAAVTPIVYIVPPMMPKFPASYSYPY